MRATVVKTEEGDNRNYHHEDHLQCLSDLISASRFHQFLYPVFFFHIVRGHGTTAGSTGHGEATGRPATRRVDVVNPAVLHCHSNLIVPSIRVYRCFVLKCGERQV